MNVVRKRNYNHGWTRIHTDTESLASVCICADEFGVSRQKNSVPKPFSVYMGVNPWLIACRFIELGKHVIEFRRLIKTHGLLQSTLIAKEQALGLEKEWPSPRPEEEGMMPEQHQQRRLQIHGRLGYGTFIKICFIGAMGSSVLMGLVFLLASVAGRLWRRGDSVAYDQSLHALIALWPLGALALVEWLVSAVLIGVIGYPVYRWLTKTRWGGAHAVIQTEGEAAIDSGRTFDAKRLMQSCRHYRAIIPVMMVLGVVVVLIHLQTRAPVYEASSLILVGRGVVDPANTHSDDEVDTRIRIITSHSVMDAAKKRLSYSKDELDALLGEVRVSRVGRSSMISIRVVSADPDVSARLANALVEESMQYKPSNDAISLRVLEAAQPPDEPSHPAASALITLSLVVSASVGALLVLLLASFRYARVAAGPASAT